MRHSFIVMIAAVLVHGTRVPAQAPDALIPAAHLREDVAIARAALRQSQVGMTWFQSQRAFDASFDALERSLTAPRTRRDVHRQLAPLIAALGHGHVTLERPVPAIGYRTRFLDSTGRYLPFALRVVDRRVYITADLSDTARVPAGTELLSVNGVPTATLIDTLQRYLSADGRNTSFKRYQLGAHWRFHELLDLVYGARTMGRVQLRLADGALVSRTLSFATPRELIDRHAARVGTAIDTYPPAVAVRLLRPGVALLTVSSFYEGLLSKTDSSFEAAFTRAFRLIADSAVTDLLIDVRGNEGGNGDYPPLLYSFLASRAFTQDGRTVVAGDSLTWLRYAPDASDEVRAFAASPGDFVERSADGSWQLKPAFAPARTVEPRPNPYRGRLYVLTDGGSFSATNSFVWLVARSRARGGRSAVFVGEENGGDNVAGRVTGGTQVTLVLPHSKERLTLSLTGTVPKPGAGPVIVRVPDVRVVPNAASIAAGKDVVVERVAALIDRARTGSRGHSARRQDGTSPDRP